MNREELLILLNVLRTCVPQRQDQVTEWAQAVHIVVEALEVEESHDR